VVWDLFRAQIKGERMGRKRKSKDEEGEREEEEEEVPG
jgi:hypothetical protein